MLISAIVGVTMLAEAGLSTSTTYYSARHIAGNDSIALGQTLTATLTATAALAMLASLVLLLGRGGLVRFFDTLDPGQQAAAHRALGIGIIAVVAMLFQNVLVGLIRGCQRYDVSNVLSTAQVAATTVGYILISGRGGGVTALMSWQASVALVWVVVYAGASSYLLRGRRVRAQWRWDRMVAVWRYSGMTWVGTLGGALFGQIDRLVVGKVLGASTLAVYVVITSTVKQINTFSAMPVQPLLPRLSQLAALADGAAAIRRQVRVAFQVNAFIALGLGMGMFTMAPVILDILLARPASTLELAALRIACVIYALYSINGAGFYILLGLHGVRAFMTIQLSSGLLALVLVALGAQYGLLGAVWGNIGYLGVWAFSIVGMRLAEVPVSTWEGWVRPALLVFGVAVSTTLVLPSAASTPILMGAAFLQAAVLTFWFVRQQPTILKTLLDPVWRR